VQLQRSNQLKPQARLVAKAKALPLKKPYVPQKSYVPRAQRQAMEKSFVGKPFLSVAKVVKNVENKAKAKAKARSLSNRTRPRRYRRYRRRYHRRSGARGALRNIKKAIKQVDKYAQDEASARLKWHLLQAAAHAAKQMAAEQGLKVAALERKYLNKGKKSNKVSSKSKNSKKAPLSKRRMGGTGALSGFKSRRLKVASRHGKHHMAGSKPKIAGRRVKAASQVASKAASKPKIAGRRIKAASQVASKTASKPTKIAGRRVVSAAPKVSKRVAKLASNILNGNADSSLVDEVSQKDLVAAFYAQARAAAKKSTD